MAPVLPSQSRSVISLASLYIVRMLGLFMVLPVLSLAADDYTGSSLFLLGLALGIYGLTQACLQIPFGVMSDRYGRKPLIIVGLLLFALGSFLAAIATTVEGLIIGRALQGAGAIAGVIMAMVGDLTSEQNRSKAMATIGASIGIAFALSLVIGPLVTSVAGVRGVFWLTLALALVGIAIVVWGVPSVPQQTARPSLSLSSLQSVLASRALWHLNLGIFVLHAVLMALFVALPLLLKQVGIPNLSHSWVYLLVMTAAFICMVPLMILGERRQKVKVIFVSMLGLAAVALAGLAIVALSKAVVITAMLLFFIAFNYLEATLPSLMSKTVPSIYRGAGSGLFSTCQFLGAACGGVLGGWLFDRYGLSAMLVACVLAIGLWLVSACFMSLPKPQLVKTKNVVA